MNRKKEYLRLLEIVKSELERSGAPHTNEAIGRALGYKSRTSYQNLIGGGGKVTDEHIKQLKLHFPFLSQNVTSKETEEGPEFKNIVESDPMSIIAILVRNNETLVKSNEKLVNLITANSGGSA